MPKPALFAGRGESCPAESISGWLQYYCSTIILEIGDEKARIRTYNELFLIFMGLLVLVVVWLILKRTRLGMIIRAGVQDSEMVEGLLIVLMGGLGALGGAMLGAGLFKFMDSYFNKWFGESASFLVGMIYVLIVLFLPYGIVGAWRMKQWSRQQGWNRLRKRFGIG